jgi:hypothetical protein
MVNGKKTIEVCNSCETASCWYGELMCDEAMVSGTKEMTVAELRKKGKENEEYWSTEKMTEIYGEPDPFNSSNRRSY